MFSGKLQLQFHLLILRLSFLFVTKQSHTAERVLTLDQFGNHFKMVVHETFFDGYLKFSVQSMTKTKRSDYRYGTIYSLVS